jgi:hypothetical protein
MKKVWKLFILALLGLIITGVTGCKKDASATPEDMMKKTTEAIPAAPQVPKDHPAH